MHPGGSSKALLFAVMLSLMILTAGCGGNDQSGDGGSQEGGNDGSGGTAKKDARQTKIALGTVKFVNPDKRTFNVKPAAEVQGEGFLAFKLTANATITLDGKKVEPADMKKGQQAQVEYVEPEKEGRRNGARVVRLFAGETPAGDGQNSGGEGAG